MTPMKEYEAMTLSGQEKFLAHASADLVQKLYYENNRDGLHVVVKNLTLVIERAKDCLACLDMLSKEGDVYSKIYLLLEYMGKGGISEEFVSGLVEISERAQEVFARETGTPESEEEEREVLKRLNEAMNMHEIRAMREEKERQKATAQAPQSAATSTAAAAKTPVREQGTAKTAAQAQRTVNVA